MGRVFGFLEVNFVRKKRKIYPNIKIPEIFGLLDLGLRHMIVPFWSRNLSDTIHVRSHTKFQLIWALNSAFTRAPPQNKCVAGTPSLLGLKEIISMYLNSILENNTSNVQLASFIRDETPIFIFVNF